MAFIDIKESQALADEIGGHGGIVRFEKADLTDIGALRASLERIREAFGPVQIHVYNAAHDERHPTPDVTPEY